MSIEQWTGLGQFVLALLLWMGLDIKVLHGRVKEMPSRNKWIGLLILGGFIFSGFGFYRASMKKEPAPVAKSVATVPPIEIAPQSNAIVTPVAPKRLGRPKVAPVVTIPQPPAVTTNGPNSPVTLGANSPVTQTFNPDVNPNKPVVTYDCAGGWRSAGPGAQAALEINTGGDAESFFFYSTHGRLTSRLTSSRPQCRLQTPSASSPRRYLFMKSAGARIERRTFCICTTRSKSSEHGCQSYRSYINLS
jgi:hypothetical protein